jgi:hypothetical protein
MTSLSFQNPDVYLSKSCARTKQEKKIKWQMHKLGCIIALQTLCMHIISELQYPINHIAGYHQ